MNNETPKTAELDTLSRRVQHGVSRKYRTILIDPPWEQTMTGKYKARHKRPESLPYQTMDLFSIALLPVSLFADDDCHLWLWTTNQFLEDGFKLMRLWGFKYLAPIHWIKPNGMGNYFIHRTQTLLFGYNKKCKFEIERYKPNIIEAPTPTKHSKKPEISYSLIESISQAPRLELFARQKRPGWDVWGNEVESDIELNG